MDECEKSMERTIALLDTVNLEELLFREASEREMEVWALMDRLDEMLHDEVLKYPELEGYLFDCMNDAEFIDYVYDRYKGRLNTREVTINYISIV